MIQAVLKGISNALFWEFGYENYIEEIRQDLQEPCFFISCIQPSIRQYLGKRYLAENQFVIQYFPESQNDANAECYEIAEKMLWCLEVILVDNKPFRGNKMKYEVLDGMLHFFVNYDFFLQKTGQEAAMGEIESHITGKVW